MADIPNFQGSVEDAVGAALRVLHGALRAFVESEMSARYQSDWERVARSSLLSPPADVEFDVATLLQIIEKNWNSVFVRRLSQNDRGHVSELRGVRNQWAHQRPFSKADALRALDTMQRLLRSMGALSESSRCLELANAVAPERTLPAPNAGGREHAAPRVPRGREVAESKPIAPQLEPLAAAFVSVCGPVCRAFGSPSLGGVGCSDDAAGVQWNLGLDLSSGEATLGVNLEGMAYDGWPVGRLIEAELKSPELIGLASVIQNADSVVVRWRRDCWQAASRLKIREADISPTPAVLSSLTREGWLTALRSAHACLDEERGHRGRARQVVTTFASGVRALKDVSPHLHIGLSLRVPSQRGPEESVRRAHEALLPIYEWATRQAAR